MSHGGLIERETEQARLDDVLQEARAGRGALVLVTGEAGVGKTRFAESVADAAGVRLLRGAAGPGAPPYGPVTAALRAFLRATPGGLAGCGPLRAHLALLLPELGAPIAESDRPTLVEAIRCALAEVVADAPAMLLLDDLQWSDDATLELLAALAGTLRDLPLLVVAAYRSDEVPRAHQLRRLRTDLRRNQQLLEITLEPLGEDGVGTLAAAVLGSPPSPRLTATLHDRTGGVPFFVEELAAALEASGRLHAGPDGPGAVARRRRAAAPDRPRRRPAARERPLHARPRRRRGGRRRRRPLRPRGRRGAVLGGRAGRAARKRPDRRAGAGPRRVPPPAGARRALRGRPVAAPPRAPPRARRRVRLPARRAGRGGRPLARRPRRRARARRARARRRRARRGPRLPRRRPARAPGARPLARGRARAGADRRAGAPRALLRAGGRAGRGDAGAARGRRRPPRGGRRPRARRRGAQPGRHLRAARRPRPRADRTAGRRRRVRRERLPRRGGVGAPDRSGLPRQRRQAARGDRAGRRGRRGGRAGRARRPPRPRARAAGDRAGQGRRVRRRHGGDPLRPLARAGARADAGGGRALPAARDRARDRRRLRRRPRRARHGGRLLRGERRRRPQAHLLRLPRLRAARARRLGPRGGALRAT